jgi:hypothetical protein
MITWRVSGVGLIKIQVVFLFQGGKLQPVLFILFSLFNDAVSNTSYIVLNDWITVNNKSDWIWKESWPNLRYCLGIYLEGWKETMTNQSS